MLTAIAIRKVVPQVLLQRLSSIIPGFATAPDDEIIMHLYNWGNDKDNYYYPPNSDYAAMQMSVQMKSFKHKDKKAITTADAYSVIIDAFEMYNNK
jgi:hypothetical protein